jgi:hypothetical protein
VNWINTNISKIQKYITKKDRLTLGVIILLAINIGLGLGYFIDVKFFPKTEIFKNASASQIEKNELLNVELGVTLEEKEILDEIQKQNEQNFDLKTTASLTQSSITISSKIEEIKTKEDKPTIDQIQPPTPISTKVIEAKNVPNIENTIPQTSNSNISNIKSPNFTKTSAAEITDANGRKITYNLKRSGINAGYVWDTDIAELGQEHPFSFGINENESTYFPTQPKHIEQIIPAQNDCPNYVTTIQRQRNWLSFDKYGVEAPIQNGSFGDFYNYNNDGQINLNSEIQENPRDIANGNYESVPVQKLLKAGVVHLPISPAPGQVGNSYIIGHTSNFPQVRSAYNKIFKSFESKSRIGDEFTIWDHKCRQMTFRVFEAFAIGENDSSTAYQNMGSRRVVTLQGSILDANWQPTKRWLTRGELVE